MAAQITVNLNGKDFVCSPLALKDLKRFSQIIQNRKENTPFESMSEMAEVILISLQKTAPELDMDFIEEHVNMVNYYEVVNAVMSASGLRSALPAKESAGPEIVGEVKRPAVSA